MPSPPLPHTADATASTREKLLDIAERLFAESGYAGTSVRDITRAAGCNLASVNYHFAGKAGLYREVFLRRLVALRELRIASVRGQVTDTAGKMTAESVLRAFATAFLEPLVNESAGRLFVTLWARERLDPQLPRELFEAEMVDPVRGALHDALALVDPRVGDALLGQCIDSFIAQLIMVAHLPMADRNETPRRGTLSLTARIDHIVRFTASGIRCYAGGNP